MTGDISGKSYSGAFLTNQGHSRWQLHIVFMDTISKEYSAMSYNCYSYD